MRLPLRPEHTTALEQGEPVFAYLGPLQVVVNRVQPLDSHVREKLAAIFAPEESEAAS
jgi:hypothetical protein